MPEPITKKYMFKSVKELQDTANAESNPIKKYTAHWMVVFTSLQKLYQEACKKQKDNDLENAFILFRRYLEAFIYCLKTFKKEDDQENGNAYDEKFVYLMYGKEWKDATERSEEILETLRKIYASLNVLEIKETSQIAVDSTATSKLPQTTLEKADPRYNLLNGVSIRSEEKISITCQEIFETSLKNEKIPFLVVDVRLKEDYLLSRMQIRCVDVINVSEDVIGQALIPSKLETLLEPEFQELFKRRGDYFQVILMDWFTTEESFNLNASSPIHLMSSKLKKFDPKTKYKNKPLILEGGYEEWLARYPNCTTNSQVSPPKKKINDPRISITLINYPTNALLEPEIVEKKPATPTPPQDRPSTPEVDKLAKVKPTVSVQENTTKPTFDRSTKPTLQEKQPETSSKENGIASPLEKKLVPEQPTEQIPSTKDENSLSEKRVESFEEDEEELKNKCVRNGRRPALTSLSNQSISINKNSNKAGSIESDEDLNASYRDEEKENRTKMMKNASPNMHDETSSNLKRYSSTPNISKLENEYSKPTIDRSTKPSNDDQINIFTKTAMYTDEEGRGLTGLLNVGNTCYMNSILQCLSNTEHLRKLMCMLAYNFTNPKSKTEGLIAREVSNIIKQLWIKDNGPVSCRSLKSIVGKYRDTFRGSEQQDSHEFLTILIDWLHEDLNEPVAERSLKGADEKNGEKAWGEFISKNNSRIRQLFYGQQKSTVSCNTCEKESVTFEPFSNLSLPIPSAEKSTLAECLKLYTSNEHISGWQCPACKCPRAATKKLDITKLPPLLVIHFKRFTSDGWCRKRLTNVDFPNLLDMTPYIIGQEHRNRRYELYAVSNHMGTMETGHYTAYCRNSVNGRWYKFDDDSVSCINNVTKSSSAYIVFYQCLLNN